jgi:ABC-type Zn uptake system ZnuABC Zn-binding protein ZnuA
VPGLSVRPSHTARLLAIALAVAACGGPGAPTSSSPAGEKLDVVTTTTVFADIVANVGGNRVTATSIIPPGVGPEDYEPQPDDAILLAKADLVVSNGVGLDDWLTDLLQSGGEGSTPKLVLGDGIPTIDVDGEPNPHFWLDPSLVKQYYVPKILNALSAADAAGAATYQANAQAYSASLDQLDADLKALVGQIPAENRKLVTFHDAFPYLARHFGFDVVGVVLANVGQEPTAAELAQLVETVKAAHVKAVFSEAQFSPKLAQTLADEAGIEHIVTTLYNDALGPAPADTYLGLMRYDMEQIVAALK